VPVWQGAKVQAYQDMSNFRNAAGRDASALKNVKLFLREPLISRLLPDSVDSNVSENNLLQSGYRV
jgi:hypothetical protein